MKYSPAGIGLMFIQGLHWALPPFILDYQASFVELVLSTNKKVVTL